MWTDEVSLVSTSFFGQRKFPFFFKMSGKPETLNPTRYEVVKAKLTPRERTEMTLTLCPQVSKDQTLLYVVRVPNTLRRRTITHKYETFETK